VRETTDVKLDAEAKQWPLVLAGIEDAEVELRNLFDLAEAEKWQDSALCAETDPEEFFPAKGGSTATAKRICMACGVRDECLEYAMRIGERFGIYGGLTERERRKLKKSRTAHQATIVAEAA
jgi:WhiB family redox-sensing transcriptional regulator